MLVFPILTIIALFSIFYFDKQPLKNRACVISIVLMIVFIILAMSSWCFVPKKYNRIESYTYSVDSSLTTTVTITDDEYNLYEKNNKVYIRPDDWNWKYYFIPFNDEMYEVEIKGELLNIQYPDAKIVEYKKAPSVEEIMKGE
jgi:hypothetical protein